MKILVTRQSLAERIRERLPEEIEIVTPPVGDDEELVSLAADIDVIVSTRLSPEAASAAGNLSARAQQGYL